MTCPNCGASMKDVHKCEYCGSEFSVAYGDASNVILKLGNEVISCYVSQIDTDIIEPIQYSRDVCGRIIKSDPIIRRTFILKEF